MQRKRKQGVSIHLTFDRSYVSRPVEKDDWEKIKRFLDVLLYDIRFVEVAFAPPVPVREKKGFIPRTGEVGSSTLPPRINI
jgi:hypothetical protein